MITFNHFNFNVLDLEKSLAFYKEALNLEPVREKNASDGSFKLVYLGDGVTDFTLELTWLRDRKEAYDLGECEFHLAFHVDDFDGTHKHHEEMGCICYENPGMGIYFIKDPDGYWLEIAAAEDRGRHNGRIWSCCFGVWDFTVLYSSSAAHHLHPCLLDDIQ